MLKSRKKFWILLGMLMLVLCVGACFKRNYILNAISSCKNKVYSTYENYKVRNASHEALKDFLDGEIKPHSVVIFEPNPYHHECTPGYTKYFTDLGYNVDIFIMAGNNDALELFEPKDKIRIFNFDSLDQITHVSKELASKFNNYDYTFIQTSDPNKKELMESLGFLNNPKSLFVYHDSDFATGMGMEDYFNQNRILTLGDFEKGLYVNPHYFGNITRKEKNKKTRFFMTSTGGGRKYDNLIDAALKLKRKNLDFEVIVTGRSSAFSSESLPEELKDNFIFKHGLPYKEMYKEVENCDYIIVTLDPDNPNDDVFRRCRVTGSMQLVYGFLKPVIIHEDFAEFYKLNEKNSFLHTNDIEKTMRQAINLTAEDYKIKQDNLDELSKSIYSISLENLKKALKI